MLSCPECDSTDIHGEENYRRRNQLDTVVECYCNECGCKWDELTTIEITNHGHLEAEDDIEE